MAAVEKALDSILNHGTASTSALADVREKSPVSFNFLGSFSDDLIHEIFEDIELDLGEEYTSSFLRCPLDFNIELQRGELLLQLDYADFYEDNDINKLLKDFEQQLIKVAQLGDTEAALNAEPNFVASDIDSSNLDDILAELNRL
ncbi:MAG: hypothetical protein GX217_05910 [Clostridiaceae bacterium]|nr:hypothetical protein [Clostridiaceae bacterium]